MSFSMSGQILQNFFIITDDDIPVGSYELILFKDTGYCNISRLIISDEHRNKGYGAEACGLYLNMQHK